MLNTGAVVSMIDMNICDENDADRCLLADTGLHDILTWRRFTGPVTRPREPQKIPARPPYRAHSGQDVACPAGWLTATLVGSGTPGLRPALLVTKARP